MKPKTKKRTGIKAKIKFYLWLVSIGTDLKNFEPENIEIHEIPARQKSSFKKRSQEIKEKFNYIFKMREQDFLGDYKQLETLTFERKTA